MDRRRYLALAGAGALGSLGGCLDALRSDADAGTDTVGTGTPTDGDTTGGSETSSPDSTVDVTVGEAFTGFSNP